MASDDAKLQAFRERANRAAAAIVAENHNGTVFSYDRLIHMVALGWLQGAEDGRRDALAHLGVEHE